MPNADFSHQAECARSPCEESQFLDSVTEKGWKDMGVV